METLSVQVDEAKMARIFIAMRARGVVERAEYVRLALMRALDEDAPAPADVAVTGEDIKKLMGILTGFKDKYELIEEDFVSVGERLHRIEKRLSRLDREPRA